MNVNRSLMAVQPMKEFQNTAASSSVQLMRTPPRRSTTLKIVKSPLGNVYSYDNVNDKLGSGISSNVYKARDATGKLFALKIFSSNYEDPGVQEIETGCRKHETQILGRLKGLDPTNQHFVREYESFEESNDYYIVCDLLGEDLYSIYQENFSLDYIRNIALRMLVKLKYLEKGNIVHGDLKPANIVFDGPKRESVHLIDFGLSTDLNADNPNEYQPIYQTVNYRSAEMAMVNEVIPGSQVPRNFNPSPKIDMWSLGCVLFELYTKKMLFEVKDPIGKVAEFDIKDENKRLLLVQSSILGAPPIEMQEKCELFKDPRFAKAVNAHKTNQLALSILKIKSKGDQYQNQVKFMDLVSQMIQHDPSQRIKPEEALRHPFFLSDASAASSSSPSNSSSSSSAISLDGNDLIVASVAAPGEPRPISTPLEESASAAVPSHKSTLRKRKVSVDRCPLPFDQTNESPPAGKRNKN